jgi:hypothetical protein
MPKLTKFQQTKCLEITGKLISWPICSPFIEMVDPVRDNAPDYFEVIEEPMALNEVRRKLTLNEYDSVEAWKHDINQIWKNARFYNGDGHLLAQTAQEASLWFNQKVKRLPATQEEDWIVKIELASKRLVEAVSHPPGEPNTSEKLPAVVANDDNERTDE